MTECCYALADWCKLESVLHVVLIGWCVVMHAVPSGITSLTVQSPTPTSVLLYWSPPTAPNGDILLYQLQRMQYPSPIVYTLGNISATASNLQYVDSSALLRPYTNYSYQLSAMTSAGWGYGPWVSIVTKPSSE